MQGKQGIMLAVGLIALVGIGVALIMSMGAPQQNPSTVTSPGGAPPPLTNPNDIGSSPPETGTAADMTSNSTANQSQSGATASGGLYGP